MDNLKNFYFTVGEFDELFGVSKHTLFYYEKNKIFMPEHINANGYRYYSLKQYFIFEIIISMRKLDIPLKEIRLYLNNRNLKDLKSIFLKQIHAYDAQIERIKHNRANLVARLKNISIVDQITLDYFTLEECDARYYIASQEVIDRSSMKSQIQELARHNLPFAKSTIINEYMTGYILPQKYLLSGDYKQLQHFFTIVDKNEYPEAKCMPRGLYATITMPDANHKNYRLVVEKLVAFIKKNDLEIITDGYLLQLRNFWSTEKLEEFVTKFSIGVRQKAKKEDCTLSY